MKLTSEQMKDVLDSHSDCSDDDPDFSFERHKKQGKASWLSRQGSSSSSKEVDDPDEKAGRRKVARKEKTPKEPGAIKRPVGRPRKDSAKPPEANTPRRPRGRPSKSHAAVLATANGSSPAAATPTATTPATTTPAATNGSGPAETSGQTSSGTPPAQVVPSQVAPSQVAAVRSTPVTMNLWNGVPVVMPTTSPRQSQSPHDYYCCVRGCKSRDTTDKDGLWLFALPEDPELHRVWDERLPINHERNRPQSPRVCFRHFDKDDYVRRQRRVAGLRQGALPLIETGRT
ncbi:uncharacterized protein LOC144143572 isoform X2 [Haemaphysalis longicornis]